MDFHVDQTNCGRVGPGIEFPPNLIDLCRWSFVFPRFGSELRYDSLCKQIIRDMNMYGMCVVDDFLGMGNGLRILTEGNLEWWPLRGCEAFGRVIRHLCVVFFRCNSYSARAV